MRVASRGKGKKSPWSRERWFLVLLSPLYVALVVYCLVEGGFATEPAMQAEQAPRGSNVIQLTLPTSDPARVTPQPPQRPADALRKLDVNQADAWMLTAIPGIGQALADRIVIYRDAQGGLTDIEELGRIEGVGEKLFATLVQYLEVR